MTMTAVYRQLNYVTVYHCTR